MTDRVDSIEELLSSARSRLGRLSPAEAFEAAQGDAVIIDIRSDAQRAADGTIPEAHYISRNVLEWRLDPASEHCHPELVRSGRRVILICNQGYQSSLAAATVLRFGLDATDVTGGFEAWREAGLPVERGL